MAHSGSANKRTRRKERQKKERRRQSMSRAQSEKSIFYYFEALRSLELERHHSKTLALLEKAIKCDPGNRDAVEELIRLGLSIQDNSLVVKGLLKFYEQGMMQNTPDNNENILFLCQQLAMSGQSYETCFLASC